jgi:hypothetical protein
MIPDKISNTTVFVDDAMGNAFSSSRQLSIPFFSSAQDVTDSSMEVGNLHACFLERLPKLITFCSAHAAGPITRSFSGESLHQDVVDISPWYPVIIALSFVFPCEQFRRRRTTSFGQETEGTDLSL